MWRQQSSRYTAVVKWLLKSASHKHFPSHCPDSSFADLNGDLWFFPFLITVQAFSCARFLWGPKWFPFSLNFFLPGVPSSPVGCFNALRDPDFSLCFCFSLERHRVYNEHPICRLALVLRAPPLQLRFSSSWRGGWWAMAPPTSQVPGAHSEKALYPNSPKSPEASEMFSASRSHCPWSNTDPTHTDPSGRTPTACQVGAGDSQD